MLGASGRRRARRKSQFGSCVPAQQDVQASTVAVDEAQIIRLIGRVAPRRAFFCRPSTPPAQGLQRQGPPERPRGRGAPGRRARERRQGSAAPRDAEPPSPTPSEAEAPPGRRTAPAVEARVHPAVLPRVPRARESGVRVRGSEGRARPPRLLRRAPRRPPPGPLARLSPAGRAAGAHEAPPRGHHPLPQATRRRDPRRRGSSSAARTRCSRSGSAASRRSTRRACSPSSRASSARSRI